MSCNSIIHHHWNRLFKLYRFVPWSKSTVINAASPEGLAQEQHTSTGERRSNDDSHMHRPGVGLSAGRCFRERSNSRLLWLSIIQVRAALGHKLTDFHHHPPPPWMLLPINSNQYTVSLRSTWRWWRRRHRQWLVVMIVSTIITNHNIDDTVMMIVVWWWCNE